MQQELCDSVLAIAGQILQHNTRRLRPTGVKRRLGRVRRWRRRGRRIMRRTVGNRKRLTWAKARPTGTLIPSRLTTSQEVALGAKHRQDRWFESDQFGTARWPDRRHRPRLFEQRRPVCRLRPGQTGSRARMPDDRLVPLVN